MRQSLKQVSVLYGRMSLLEWPGMTRLGKGPCDDLHTLQKITDTPKLFERKIILLATATITDENIFCNGLFQNVFFLFRMFDAMGFLPILVVNDKPKSLDKIPEILHGVRIVCVEDLVKQPLPIAAYIEIGMSIDHTIRKFLKMIGSKTCKLYLGNILNIDTETPVFYPGMNFAHHVVGEIQDVWVSPHYGQHAEYACVLNDVDPTGPGEKIAPYVWDSAILTMDGTRNLVWKRPPADEKDVFVIMEPNISFQKTSLIPLMILETWFRAHPTWSGKVVIVNGERITTLPYFRENILETLDLWKSDRVEIRGRMDMISILREFPSATFLCHQVNNEFNYMLLELLWSGFPVIHNASAWSEFGYSYTGSNLKQGASLIDAVRQQHHDRLEIYKSHARILAWRHSPYNPEVHRAWLKVLNLS